ncbi:hypothetical protein [Arenibaculum sp.]|uniref:hypothetical protein n=1 Tax=Arenibaculum sp. TaxID=2865862 RepID=UPI002E10AF57|nr:hypothetical protein [Arenibaculum sp.]
MPNHLSFSIRRDQLTSRILIPKYYDPELTESLGVAEQQFELVPLRELLEPGDAGSRLGDWIRREHYGSGEIPFVRTSDLSHWRVRADFKKGVSEDIYLEYAAKQDVRANDILMVAHGTYLVGAVAIVTASETRMVLQDHVFRLRLCEDAPVSAHYLLAALTTSFCRRQIRARQFSADIIDKIGDRHLEVHVPIPRDQRLVDTVSTMVRSIVDGQDAARREISAVCDSNMRMLRERAEARFAFAVPVAGIRNRVLLPKYYDPVLEAALTQAEAADTEPWVTVGDLVEQGMLSAATGIEVGKLAYGTGTIPFLRTSDIADLEVKRDPKQGVSEAIYHEHALKAAVESEDLLLVRDGTYLVGSTAIVGADVGRALVCGGLYRLRVRDRERLDPYVLLALLNHPLARRQMRARQFTRDVIDTLGKRLLEVKIPSPFSDSAREKGRRLAEVMQHKTELKSQISAAIALLEPPIPPVARGRPGWSMRG